MIPTFPRDYLGEKDSAPPPPKEKPEVNTLPPKVTKQVPTPKSQTPNIEISILESVPDRIVDQLGKSEIEALTGFSPDLPELLAYVDIGNLTGSVESEALSSCFNLKTQADALRLQQIETALSTANNTTTSKDLINNRVINGSLDSVNSLSKFILNLSSQFKQLNKALDPRNSENRLTISFLEKNKDLLVNLTASLQQNPVDALVMNGFGQKNVLVESCTATKTFMLLTVAANKSSQVSTFYPKILVQANQPAASFTNTPITIVNLNTLSSLTLDSLLQASTDKITQIYSGVSSAVKAIDTTLLPETALSQLLVSLAREYRLSAAVHTNKVSKLVSLLKIANETPYDKNISNNLFGILPFDILSAQVSGSILNSSYSVINNKQILTYDNVYIGDKLPGQQYYFESLLGTSVDVFSLAGIESLNLQSNQLLTNLKEWLTLIIPPSVQKTERISLYDQLSVPNLLNDLIISKIPVSTVDPFLLIMKLASTNVSLNAALFLYIASRLVRYINDGTTIVAKRDFAEITTLSNFAFNEIINQLFKNDNKVSQQNFDFTISKQDVKIALEQKNGAFAIFIDLIANIMDAFRQAQLNSNTLFSNITDASILLLLHKILTYSVSNNMLNSIIATNSTELFVLKNRTIKQNLVSQQVANIENSSIVMNIALYSYLSLIESNTSAILNSLRQQSSQKQLQLLRAAAGDSAKYIMESRQLNHIESVLSDMLSATKATDKFVIDTNFLSENTANLIVKISAQLPKSILAVALPYGFMSIFGKKISLNDQFISQLNPEIIKINVYKRNMLYPTIRYKNISLLFDTARFVVRDQNKHLKNQINNELYSIPTRRIGAGKSDIEFLENVKQNTKIALSDYDYNWLTKTQKEEICNNHVISYVLETLLKTTFDIDFNESNWWIKNSPTTFDSDLVNVLYETYVSNLMLLPAQPARQLSDVNNIKTITYQPSKFTNQTLSNKQLNVANEAYDIAIKSGKIISTLSDPLIVSRKILTARKFDRIFLLPYDQNAFIVDEQLSRQNGASELDINAAKNLTQNDLSGVFITIETL